jgi:hypothetical protein
MKVRTKIKTNENNRKTTYVYDYSYVLLSCTNYKNDRFEGLNYFRNGKFCSLRFYKQSCRDYFGQQKYDFSLKYASYILKTEAEKPDLSVME